MNINREPNTSLRDSYFHRYKLVVFLQHLDKLPKSFYILLQLPLIFQEIHLQDTFTFNFG